MKLDKLILKNYLEAQEGLTEIEQVDENNVVLSLPLHFSANTRVEVTVTRITDDHFAISDMAQTLGELRDAGYGIKGKLKKKVEGIAKTAGLEFKGNHLVRQVSADHLGEAIHQFADAAKTIGDAYLTYGHKHSRDEEDELVTRVRDVFTERKYKYKEKQEVPGSIEQHTVDFYVAPNGTRGLVLAVLPNPIRLVAEAWAFKSDDIRKAQKNIAVTVVYDSSKAPAISKAILDKVVDLSVPSNQVGSLGELLSKAGFAGHKR